MDNLYITNKMKYMEVRVSHRRTLVEGVVCEGAVGQVKVGYLSIPNIVSLEPIGYPTLSVHQP